LTDLAIGLIPGTHHFQSAVPFERGDMVVMYTDGWTEAVRPDGERVTESDFLRLVNRAGTETARVFRDDLVRLYAEELGVGEFADDVALVVIRRAR
jgi:sigma-B regulation protein RsbU (phosphoserine phosphatase)